MTMTETEKIGFGRQVRELVNTEPEVLTKAGTDPKEVDRILGEKEEKAVAAHARQEDAKRVSLAATAADEAASDDYYRAASGYLDVMIAAAGKGSIKARNFQRLRSRVRDPDAPEAPAVEPVQPSP